MDYNRRQFKKHVKQSKRKKKLRGQSYKADWRNARATIAMIKNFPKRFQNPDDTSTDTKRPDGKDS